MNNNPWLRIFFIYAIFVSAVCTAADFEATVSSMHGNVGQSINLSLRLLDTEAQENPDLTPLLKNFNISTQQKMYSTSVIYGKKSTETVWNIMLIPKVAGEITIPKITISTKQGMLATNPLKIAISQYNKQLTNGQQGINLTAEITKTTTYLREPVIYTIKIISDFPWTSTSLPDISAPGIITEVVAGWPKQYKQIYGNRYSIITEIKYYVTPISAGKLELAAPTLEGEIQSAVGMINGYYDLNPFIIQGEPMILNILEPPIATKDWSPLQELVLEEEWSGLDNVKVGDTITRRVTMLAKGNFSSQLPEIRTAQENDQLKVYVNKSTSTDNLEEKSNTIVSTRQEEFALVPKESGEIALPAINIKWWNLRTNKLEIATLPAKNINVAPPVVLESAIIQDFASGPASSNKRWYYVLFFFLVGILAVFLGLLARKMLSKYHSFKLKLPENVTGLKKYMLEYAVKYWAAPANISLQALPNYLIENNFSFDLAAYFSLVNKLNLRLYAERDVAFEMLMSEWLAFRKTVRRQVRVKDKLVATERINPT